MNGAAVAVPCALVALLAGSAPAAGRLESTYSWTSTAWANDPTFVWCVDLLDGLVFYAQEVNYYYVWPVRGGR